TFLERVSVSSSGAQANGASTLGTFFNAPETLSADGRFVVFLSSATNLVSGDTNGHTDVFVRDNSTGTVERVDGSTGGAQANADASSPVISGDGRYVAFASTATNLAAADTDPLSDIYVRDRTGHTTTVVPRTPANDPDAGGAFTPVLSPNGRF